MTQCNILRTNIAIISKTSKQDSVWVSRLSIHSPGVEYLNDIREAKNSCNKKRILL